MCAKGKFKGKENKAPISRPVCKSSLGHVMELDLINPFSILQRPEAMNTGTNLGPSGGASSSPGLDLKEGNNGADCLHSESPSGLPLEVHDMLEDNAQCHDNGMPIPSNSDEHMCDQDKTLGELNFLAILETRCTKEISHQRANQLGFPNMELVDCEGYSGGNWCLWDHNITSISLLESHHQFIHLQVTRAAGLQWTLTVIYASPSCASRRILRANISRLASSMQGAWVIGGDLNGTLLFRERRSSATFRSSIDCVMDMTMKSFV
ncbi:hypothetical protein K1719_015522 [Acacia pycnantha]|nr:hypothetical protein K1719_015522 [Acacia pycnantha]